MKENVIVLGASGGIGRVIVSELVAAGHHVVAVARNRERLEALAARVAAPQRLTLLPGSVSTDADGAALVRALRGLRRRFTAAVASLRGPRESGRLLDRPAPFLTRALEEDVVTQFIAAKHLLPMLAGSRPGSLYLLLGSPAADCTWAGYGHISVGAAALRMLVGVVREEAKETAVCVQQLQIGTPVRTENNTRCACPEWIGAEEVAREVVRLIEHRPTAEPIVRIGPHTRCACGHAPANA